jgi:phage antirepressor YoqD-like protein
MKNPDCVNNQGHKASLTPTKGLNSMSTLPQVMSLTQDAQTMSSRDLLDIINDARLASGEKAIRANDFNARIEDELDGEHYETFVVQNLNNTESKFFKLNPDQCTLVSMRESKSVRRTVLAKIKILSKPVDPMQALTDPNALRGLLLTYSEKVIVLQAENDSMKTDVAALDRIAKSDGSTCVTDAAKALQVQPKFLFTWLSSHSWIYRRVGGKGWLGYQDKIQSGYIEHKITEVTRGDGTSKITEQVLITPKGLAKLAKLLAKGDAA